MGSPCLYCDEESFFSIDFYIGKVNQRVVLDCHYCYLWDSKGSHGLDDAYVADPVKCFFYVKADELEAFVVVVGLLNEVGGQDVWFLDSFLGRKAGLVGAYYGGEDLIEPSSQDL